ncbi:MAG: hypothetical protein MHM6MM_004831 [Cercozoa sp. M6MM]
MKISKCVLVGAVSASLGALAGVAVAHFARPCRAKCSSEEEVPTLDIADGDFTDKTFVAQQLMQVCPQLIADFVEHCAQHYELTEAQRERLAKMLEFNVVGGKMNRAIFLVVTAASLAKHDGKEFDKTMQRKALVLGWCIEYLQACFLVADDVMDGSETRRGQPCWYKMPGVGLDAINDALILESVIFFLTKQHFPSSQERLAFDELMRQTSLQTQMGQMFDVMGEAKDRDREEVLASFSLDQHRQIVQYKTAYYSFYMPLAAGMMLSGYGSPEQLKLCEEIAVAMGVKFQIQDDYLDCFQKPEILGKVGTDIVDFKCSWLVNQALTLCNDEQRQILLDHYGKGETGGEDEAAIKQLYNELGLQDIYLKQEEESLQNIKALIDAAADKVPHSPACVL